MLSNQLPERDSAAKKSPASSALRRLAAFIAWEGGHDNKGIPNDTL